MHWPSFILGLLCGPLLVLLAIAFVQMVRSAIEGRRRRERERSAGVAGLRFSTRLIGEIRDAAAPADERPAKAS